jgi:hypothetical protein
MKSLNPLKILFLSFLGLFIIISCSKEKLEDNSPIPLLKDVVPKITPKGTEKYLGKNSDYVFNQEEVKTYQLILREADLSKLNADPTREEYVEAALVFEGDTISPVGIRYKGSVGAYLNCLSGTDWSKPSGYKTCVKLSMQIKVNWQDRKERFYDLNKLQFHSQNYDKSQLRERLGYWLFAQIGVPAPRSVHARVVVNGQLWGLFGLTEEIDNRFAEYFYKNGKGDIYKEVWPLKPNGEVQTSKTLIDALKTNEDKPDVSFIKEFGGAFAASNAKNPMDSVRKYMDVNQIISYSVVDRLIRHDDGPFHWYCNDLVSCYNHNYYWFEDKKNRKMHLIPWDLDGAFEHVIRNANNIVPIADKWGEISNNCGLINLGNPTFKQRSAACDKLTAAWMSFKTEYSDLRKHLQQNILSDEKTIKQMDIWAKQIEPFIKEADVFYNTGITNEFNKRTTSEATWNSAINTLKSQVRFARTQP